MTEFLRYQREEVDPEKNRMTSPPEDERIEVRCIWLTEFYAPSHVPTLLSGLEKLGWRGRGGIREESLADLLRQERATEANLSLQKEVRLLTRAALAVAVLSLIVTGIQACTALSADQNQQALPQATEATVHKTREIP